MSSTTSQTITQQGPVYTKMEKDDPLKDKIIEHFNQLTFDPDFQKASATYSQIKEQHEQIRIRDAKLAKLEKDIKAQEGNKVLALSELSAVNQFLTTQKEEAEAKNFSLRKEATEREKSLTEVSRRMKELQSQIQAQLLQKSSDERKMNSIAEKYKLDIDSLQRKLKKKAMRKLTISRLPMQTLQVSLPSRRQRMVVLEKRRSLSMKRCKRLAVDLRNSMALYLYLIK